MVNVIERARFSFRRRGCVGGEVHRRDRGWRRCWLL